MKIILISLLCLILIGITSFSYAQYTVVNSNTKVPEILLQLILRDSNGNLVTYIEAERILLIYPLELNEFLENQNKKEFVIKDGKSYEIIHWQGKTQKFHTKTANSLFNLWAPGQDEFQKIIVVSHNSYQTQPGDTLTSFWTITRSAS